MRIDKWLWAARFFKTRGLAQQAIVAGRVKVDGDRTKPAQDVKLGAMLSIRAGERQWTVKVIGLSDKRGPAEAARKLYDETSESKAARERQQDVRRYSTEPALSIKGRPTKRDRRRLDRLERGD